MKSWEEKFIDFIISLQDSNLDALLFKCEKTKMCQENMWWSWSRSRCGARHLHLCFSISSDHFSQRSFPSSFVFHFYLLFLSLACDTLLLMLLKFSSSFGSIHLETSGLTSEASDHFIHSPYISLKCCKNIVNKERLTLSAPLFQVIKYILIMIFHYHSK